MKTWWKEMLMHMGQLRAVVWLSVCVLWLAPREAPGQDYDTYWQHEASTPGDWLDPGNWTHGLPSAEGDPRNAYIDNGGTVTLDHGLAGARRIYLGGASASTLVQEAGSVLEFWIITIGSGAGSSGVYELAGGEVRGMSHYGTGSIRIGWHGGDGVFRQSGGGCILGYDLLLGMGDSTGLLEITDGHMELCTDGSGIGGGGTFRQTGGTFETCEWTRDFAIGAGGKWQVGGSAEYYSHTLQVKNATMGDVEQSGGRVTIDALTVGTDYTRSIEEGDGAYLLTGGELRTPLGCKLGYVDDTGEDYLGTFRQEGGTHITGHLRLGHNPRSGGTGFAYGGAGVYEMIGGTLSAEAIYVGTKEAGTFRHTSGDVTAGVLDIGAGDLYEYTGGTLAADKLLNVRGTLDFGGTASTMTVGGGAWADLSQATVSNAESAGLTCGANTVTIVAPGADPGAIFGSFTTEGVVHEAGATLEIPAGTDLLLRQDIDDHVRCSGSLVAPEDWPHNKLTGGVSVVAGGRVDVHDVEIPDTISGTTGGELSCDRLDVAAGGAFTQSGGTVSVAEVASFECDYALHSGDLEALAISAKGQVTQTGGTMQATWESLWPGAVFRQTGGANRANELGGPGRYELSGGELRVAEEVGLMEFDQSGGTFTAGGTLTVAGDGRKLNIEAGQLNAASVDVGSSAYEGLVRQTGGTHTAGVLTVHEQGTYEFLGGTLQIEDQMLLTGEFDFGEGDGTLDILEGGVGNFAEGSMSGGGSATITAGAGTTLLFPVGFNPYTDLAHYECLGTTQLYGGVWDIPAGQTEHAVGDVHGHVRCAGRLLPASGLDGFTVHDGVEVVSGGEVDTGTGTVIVADDISGIAGGELRTTGMAVGTPEAAGTFTQSGGTVTVTASDYRSRLQVGTRWVAGELVDAGAVGTYHISDGVLNAGGISVGCGAQGRFVQTGGVVDVSGDLVVAIDVYGVADGAYEMSAGELHAGSLQIYDAGQFIHSGGHIEAEYVSARGTGTYEMSGTATVHAKGFDGGFEIASAANEVILTDSFSASRHSKLLAGNVSAQETWVLDEGGLLEQSGGTLTTEKFKIQGYVDRDEYGVYKLTGGTCEVSERFDMDGTWDLGGSSVTVDWGSVIADISHGAIINARSASWTLGPQSLLIVRPEQSPADIFGSFSCGGVTYTLGTDLTIPSGKEIFGAGRIEDRVVCRGKFLAKSGQALEPVGGINVEGGTIDLGTEGEAWIEEGGFGITGGEIRGGTLVFSPDDPTASFAHSSGTVKSDLLAVRGDYYLSGTALIDNASTTMRGTDLYQNGGTLETRELLIGALSGSRRHARYHFSAGQATATNLRVGSLGERGGVVQTGGRINAHRLFVGTRCGGRYELKGGVLDSGTTYIGQYDGPRNRDPSSFIQTDGTHNAGFVRGYPSTGGYELHGGTLNAGGAYFVEGGPFVQTGGVCDVAGTFSVLGDAGAYGVVRIEGGQFNVDTMRVGLHRRVSGELQILGGGGARFGKLLVGDCLPNENFPDATARLRLLDSDADVEISDKFTLGALADFPEPPHGTSIRMTGSAFDNRSSDAGALAGLKRLRLIFEGGSQRVDPFEVASGDMGARMGGYENNFALGTLKLGGDDVGRVQLADAFDNTAGVEALYVTNLDVGAGSTLDLNGINLYYLNSAIDPAGTIQGGTTAQVLPDSSAVLIAPSDADAVTVTANSGRGYSYGTAGIGGSAARPLSCVYSVDPEELSDALAAFDADYMTLKIAYDVAELELLELMEDSLRPYWWDGDEWVLGGTTPDGGQGAALFAGVNTDPEDYGLGYCGLNTVEDYMWVNLNHASAYGGGGFVPEPVALSLLLLGGFGLLRRRRGNK